MATELKVAIVHDWLTNLGGAERVVVALKQAYPQADIFTSVYRPDSVVGISGKIHTSFLQKWPLAARKHQLYPVLRPLAFESFDLSGYDLVISSSSAEAKGVITPTETLHIAYIHTPTRYYWSHYEEYIESPGFGPLNPLIRSLLPRFIAKRRRWDFAAAARPDILVANSSTVQGRIEKYYQRSSHVIHPPVDFARFQGASKNDNGYFLIVSRLIPYKRVDLAVRVCTDLDLPLVIVGDGPELERLKSLAGSSVTFRGNLNDNDTTKLYLNCRAFIFTAVEDFGITPLEAMSAGKPVIALGQAGASETVIDSTTGVLFAHQSERSLRAALRRFETMKFDPDVIIKHAAGYSTEIFIRNIKKLVDKHI